MCHFSVNKKRIGILIRQSIWICLVVFHTVNLVRAEIPQKMSYQAIVRNATGELVKAKKINMRVSILQGSATGTPVYVETDTSTTNNNGLAHIQLGAGKVVSGIFSTIDWANGPYFIKTETDLAGGANYTLTGVSQFMSVPYAFHSKTVEIDNVNDPDADPSNEIQLLSKTGNTITLSKSSGSVSIDDADADPTNEIQSLSINGNSLLLSKNGGTVNIPAGADNWGTQTTTTDATLSGNGTTTTPLKIAQQAATKGQVLKWSGTTWLPGNVEESNNSGFGTGDSLVLKDSRGVIRMVLNPNTGTFKMMNNDTVWYSISVNSPSEKIVKNEDGSFTETKGDNSYETYFQKGDTKQLVNTYEQKVDENSGAVNSVLTTYNNNQVIEKTTTNIAILGLGYGGEVITEEFDSDGKKASETIKEVSGFNLSEQTITKRTFDKSGNVISESKYENGNLLYHKSVDSKGTFSFLTNSEGMSLQGGGVNKFVVTPSLDGSYYVGLNDGTKNTTGWNLYSDSYGNTYVCNSPTNFLDNVFIDKNLNVNGTKNFRIDYPNDPDNKYLVHASIESNEVLNKYSGKIITDKNGESIVTLPEYFTDVNIDFRYQLTVIGVFAQAIIFREIDNNQFIIKTDQPNVKVSWEVTARRNDQYMKENPFKAVIDKVK